MANESTAYLYIFIRPDLDIEKRIQEIFKFIERTRLLNEKERVDLVNKNQIFIECGDKSETWHYVGGFDAYHLITVDNFTTLICSDALMSFLKILMSKGMIDVFRVNEHKKGRKYISFKSWESNYYGTKFNITILFKIFKNNIEKFDLNDLFKESLEKIESENLILKVNGKNKNKFLKKVYK